MGWGENWGNDWSRAFSGDVVDYYPEGQIGVLQEGGFTVVPIDPITAQRVDVPDFVGSTAGVGMTTFRRNGVDACPYFALTHEPKSPGWFIQGNAFLTLTFAVNARPPAFSSEDEVHYLFSLHEAKSGGQEMLSFGVTPSGRIVVSIQGHGDILSAQGTIAFDGRPYRVDIEHRTRPLIVATPNPPGPDVTKVSLNGVGIVTATRYPSLGFTLDSVAPKRFMFFNGIAGKSRLSASIYQCEFEMTSFPAVSGNSRAIRWEFSEGQWATVLGREVRPDSAPDPNVIPVDDGFVYGDEIVWDVTAQQYFPDLFGYSMTWEAMPVSPIGCYRRIVNPFYRKRSAREMSQSSSGPSATTYTPVPPAPIVTDPGEPAPLT